MKISADLLVSLVILFVFVLIAADRVGGSFVKGIDSEFFLGAAGFFTIYWFTKWVCTFVKNG